MDKPLEKKEREHDLEVIRGSVERIVFRNEQNQFTVAKVRTSGRSEPISIVGKILALTEGEDIEATGRWVPHKKHGLNFEVELCKTILPVTNKGIEKFLASKFVPGIGPVMAKRMVSHFGVKVFDILDNEPERIAEVEGIGRRRAEWIGDAWKKHSMIRGVMVFLGEYDVTPIYAEKIYKTYGERSVAALRENPYRLAIDIYGVGFKKSDHIASSMGIAKDSLFRAEAGVIHLLRHGLENGHVYLPWKELVQAGRQLLDQPESLVEQAIESLTEQELIVKDGSDDNARIYLTGIYKNEVAVAEALKKIFRVKKFRRPIDFDAELSKYEKYMGVRLAEQQKDAIRMAFEAKVLVITGGPGTGKTTLIRVITGIAERYGFKTELAAPTGRAARRLSEATGREAKTVHRMLKYNPSKGGFLFSGGAPIVESDMVIIDEASMVDQNLLHHILLAVDPYSSLILVGDADQLPSVGAGNVLNDIIQSDVFPVVRLSVIFRQAMKSLIVQNAHRINAGESPIIPKPKKNELADFYFIRQDDPEKIIELIKEMLIRRIPERFGMDSFRDAQVITPMNTGSLGTVVLNRQLQEALNPNGRQIQAGAGRFRIGDKVMQTRNNYDLDIFNGDLGIILKDDPQDKTIRIDFDGRRVVYPYATQDSLSLAYAVTVHKSQGSEYPAVIIPTVSQHFIMLQRNLIYTAVTRAKKLLILIGSNKALHIAIRNNEARARYTYLTERLKGIS